MIYVWQPGELAALREAIRKEFCPAGYLSDNLRAPDHLMAAAALRVFHLNHPPEPTQAEIA